MKKFFLQIFMLMMNVKSNLNKIQDQKYEKNRFFKTKTRINPLKSALLYNRLHILNTALLVTLVSVI